MRRITAGAGIYNCGGSGQTFDFFQLGLRDGVYMSEDFSFCRDWRSIGGRVLVDTTIRLRHHGARAFETDPAALLAPAVPKAA